MHLHGAAPLVVEGGGGEPGGLLLIIVRHAEYVGEGAGDQPRGAPLIGHRGLAAGEGGISDCVVVHVGLAVVVEVVVVVVRQAQHLRTDKAILAQAGEGVVEAVASPVARALLILVGGGCVGRSQGLEPDLPDGISLREQAREDDSAQRVVLAHAPLLTGALLGVLAEHGAVELVVDHERFAVLTGHLLGNLAAPPVVAVVEQERGSGSG